MVYLSHLAWWAINTANTNILANGCREVALFISTEMLSGNSHERSGSVEKEEIAEFRRETETHIRIVWRFKSEIRTHQKMFMDRNSQTMNVDIKNSPKEKKLERNREIRGGYRKLIFVLQRARIAGSFSRAKEFQEKESLRGLYVLFKLL